MHKKRYKDLGKPNYGKKPWLCYKRIFKTVLKKVNLKLLR